MKRMLFAAAFALMALPARAETPTEVIAPLYANPGSEFDIANREKFTGKAKEVLTSNEDESAEGPCIDFMLTLDAQDFDEGELARSLKFEESIDGDTATVDATFQIFGQPGEVIWSFEKEGDNWKISDVATPAENWRLSATDCTAQ